jgi:hypothetical protein
MAATLQHAFHPALADPILPALIRVCSRANKVMAQRAGHCIETSIQSTYLPPSLCVPRLVEQLRVPNKVLKMRMVHGLIACLSVYDSSSRVSVSGSWVDELEVSCINLNFFTRFI